MVTKIIEIAKDNIFEIILGIGTVVAILKGRKETAKELAETAKNTKKVNKLKKKGEKLVKKAEETSEKIKKLEGVNKNDSSN